LPFDGRPEPLLKILLFVLGNLLKPLFVQISDRDDTRTLAVSVIGIDRLAITLGTLSDRRR
jgi:hypothetical protein